MARGGLWLGAIALCILGIVLAIRYQTKPANTTQSNRSNPTEQTVALSSTSALRSTSTLSTTAPASIVAPADPGATPTFASGDANQRKAAATDPRLLAVKGMLRDYRAMLGENPIGNNAEITKALFGGNSRGVQFSNAEMKLDQNGQLIDRWNHPYFFHQLSKIDMEVRSAGPDGVMWTPDDEVAP